MSRFLAERSAAARARPAFKSIPIRRTGSPLASWAGLRDQFTQPMLVSLSIVNCQLSIVIRPRGTPIDVYRDDPGTIVTCQLSIGLTPGTRGRGRFPYLPADRLQVRVKPGR